jgi:hypothetical protein
MYVKYFIIIIINHPIDYQIINYYLIILFIVSAFCGQAFVIYGLVFILDSLYFALLNMLTNLR